MRTIKYKLGDTFSERGAVLALGFFDGVHIGHRALISYAVSEAEKRGALSAVFTFAYGCGLKEGSAMIYSEAERSFLLEEMGVDLCFVADFSDIRGLSPEDFVKKTILCDIGASLVSVGYDYRFGYKGAADASVLKRLMSAAGKEVKIFDALMLGGEPVSSTRVRAFLESGDIKEANAMLSYPYFISGTVEHGRGDGRGFGYPTINLSVDEGRTKLRYGVYLTAVEIDEKLYTGLTNVGECPSFGKRNYHAETFLTDFSGDLYGKRVRVRFLSFIREEKVFSSASELSEQIKKDLLTTEKLKGEIKWQENGHV